MKLNNETIQQLIQQGEFGKLAILVKRANLDVQNLSKITRKLRFIGEDVQEENQESYSKALQELDLQLHQLVVEIVKKGGAQVYGLVDKQVIIPKKDGIHEDASMVSYLVVNLLTKDPVGIVRSIASLTPADMGTSMEGLERGLVAELEVLRAAARSETDPEKAAYRAAVELQYHEAKRNAKQRTISVWGKNILDAAVEIVERSLSSDLIQMEIEVLVSLLLMMSMHPSSAIDTITKKTNMTDKDLRQIADKYPFGDDRRKEILAALE
ncbi:MAG: hypothetical protein ACFFAY_07545 [Promethearchaeota archaeon]